MNRNSCFCQVLSVTRSQEKKLTYRVDLSGGQRRLKEAILYVSKEGRPMMFFGRIKLNKILWRADFKSFYERGQPVTGRTYQKLEWGPALEEMVPVINDLLRERLMVEEPRQRGDTIEHRAVPRADPVLKFFSPEDIAYLNESVRHYWDMTGTESSDESHGIAWKTRNLNEGIPYEAAYFEDRLLPNSTLERFADLARKMQLRSA
jgi:hypothetical protein